MNDVHLQFEKVSDSCERKFSDKNEERTKMHLNATSNHDKLQIVRNAFWQNFAPVGVTLEG